MKRLFTYLSLISLLLLTACGDKQTATNNASKPIQVGIIIPIEHPAMDEITRGFEETLTAELKQPVEFQVMRAQGDVNLQRSMILQLQNKGVDLYAPIATATTEMTAAMIHDRPIVGLAALLPDSTRAHSQLALVDDEITPTQIMQFIHAVYPAKTQLTLVYSNNDKMAPEVAEAVAAGKALGIQVDTRMITALPDLYSIAQSLSPQTQGILVLKDVLVVSGIATLSQTAAQKHIPLISADDGSVQNGSGFAVGVKEYQIGVEGAKVAVKILQGTPAATIPLVKMTNLSVFINTKALNAQGQDIAAIEKQAAQDHYAVVDVTDKQMGTLK
jgi:putative tryptophan/tyrosine transport system substrate-binding protein